MRILLVMLAAVLVSGCVHGPRAKLAERRTALTCYVFLENSLPTTQVCARGFRIEVSRADMDIPAYVLAAHQLGLDPSDMVATPPGITPGATGDGVGGTLEPPTPVSMPKGR